MMLHAAGARVGLFVMPKRRAKRRYLCNRPFEAIVPHPTAWILAARGGNNPSTAVVFGTSSGPGRVTVALDSVTGITAQIAVESEIPFQFGRSIAQAGPAVARLSPRQHQDPSVWFAHRCVWVIYQPGGSRQDMRRRPQAAGKGYVPLTPAFAARFVMLGRTSANAPGSPALLVCVCAACPTGFSLLMQCRLSSAHQAISKFQKRRTRKYPTYLLSLSAKQPNQKRAAVLETARRLGSGRWLMFCSSGMLLVPARRRAAGDFRKKFLPWSF
jgi:hypothetical protein